MFAIVNPAAAGGRAAARWKRVEPLLAVTLGPLETHFTTGPQDLAALVEQAWSAGHRRFLAAGGDGSVSAVAHALVGQADAAGRGPAVLGAIGLGSSNDFHKPVRLRLAGCPARVGFDAARACDVGVARITGADGRTALHHWIVNASIGVTADANDFFNHPDRSLRALKRTWTDAGILYAALHTLAHARPRRLALDLDGAGELELPTRNLGVVKIPNFSGCFRYDHPHEPDSGRFHVHHLGSVSRARVLAVLAGLSRGRFTGQPGTRSWQAERLRVRDGGPFAVELDGEVQHAVEVEFFLLPKALRVCP